MATGHPPPPDAFPYFKQFKDHLNAANMKQNI